MERSIQENEPTVIERRKVFCVVENLNLSRLSAIRSIFRRRRTVSQSILCDIIIFKTARALTRKIFAGV
jgi:hypothetical protein